MSVRKVKQYSDRGRIQDLNNERESEAPQLSSSELRLKRLYEYAMSTNDAGILSALGFITTDYVADKTALPLTIYRIKQIVADIKSKSGDKIEKMTEELQNCFKFPVSQKAANYIYRNKMIKTAGRKDPPVFRRVK
jgi:hypothetical protein